MRGRKEDEDGGEPTRDSSGDLKRAAKPKSSSYLVSGKLASPEDACCLRVEYVPGTVVVCADDGNCLSLRIPSTNTLSLRALYFTL